MQSLHAMPWAGLVTVQIHSLPTQLCWSLFKFTQCPHSWAGHCSNSLTAHTALLVTVQIHTLPTYTHWNSSLTCSRSGCSRCSPETGGPHHRSCSTCGHPHGGQCPGSHVPGGQSLRSGSKDESWPRGNHAERGQSCCSYSKLLIERESLYTSH